MSQHGTQQVPTLGETTNIKQCRTIEPSLTSQSAGNDPKAPADRQHRQRNCRGINADSVRQRIKQTMPNMPLVRSTRGGQDADWPTKARAHHRTTQHQPWSGHCRRQSCRCNKDQIGRCQRGPPAGKRYLTCACGVEAAARPGPQQATAAPHIASWSAMPQRGCSGKLTSMTSRARVRGLLVTEAAEGPTSAARLAASNHASPGHLRMPMCRADKHQLHSGARHAGGGPNSKFTRP